MAILRILEPMDCVNKILLGDVREALRQLPDESVNCVVTSPPYWGLRDYGTAKWEGGSPDCDHKGRSQTSGASTLAKWKSGGGQRYKENTGGMPYRTICAKCGAVRIDNQIGLEPTMEAFAETMVEVFREIRWTLRKDGTCWLNLGDSYAGSGMGAANYPETAGNKQLTNIGSQTVKSRSAIVPSGLKPKDLCMIPARVAIALQADGWYLRSRIIWHKPNPMPESVTDRPTKSHEEIFLLTKSQRYFYDAEAIKEECSESTHARISQDLANQVGSFRANGGNKTNGPMKAVIAGGTRKLADTGSGIKNNDSFEAACCLQVTKRNKRDVWTVSTEAFSGAHFATFPQKLIEPCILAGCPEWVCKKCGKPRERIVKPSEEYAKKLGKGFNDHSRDMTAGFVRDSTAAAARCNAEYVTTGWTDCGCNAGFVPGVVLDPFFGSGTTGLVAYKNRRDYLGIELNPKYAAMAESRIQTEKDKLALFNDAI